MSINLHPPIMRFSVVEIRSTTNPLSFSPGQIVLMNISKETQVSLLTSEADDVLVSITISFSALGEMTKQNENGEDEKVKVGELFVKYLVVFDPTCKVDDIKGIFNTNSEFDAYIAAQADVAASIAFKRHVTEMGFHSNKLPFVLN